MSCVRRFGQVDVFTAVPYGGNPVAVVLEGDGLEDEVMAAFARWTNLSETTFVAAATSAGADYRLRIFTPGGEIPFAGHPTLGSAHAWLEAGGRPAGGDVIVQECGLGLVEIRRSGEVLAFRAPAPLRSGPLEGELVERIAAALRIDVGAIVDHQWVDNGPGWAAVQLASAQEVLDLRPDDVLMGEHMLGVVGAHPVGSDHAFEVRGFAGALGVREDPVTGSLNASIGQWLIGKGAAPQSYTAKQGTAIGRDGTVFVDRVDGDVWVGGVSVSCIGGTVLL